jgi:hypothetical protein
MPHAWASPDPAGRRRHGACFPLRTSTSRTPTRPPTWSAARPSVVGHKSPPPRRDWAEPTCPSSSSTQECAIRSPTVAHSRASAWVFRSPSALVWNCWRMVEWLARLTRTPAGMRGGDGVWRGAVCPTRSGGPARRAGLEGEQGGEAGHAECPRGVPHLGNNGAGIGLELPQPSQLCVDLV